MKTIYFSTPAEYRRRHLGKTLLKLKDAYAKYPQELKTATRVVYITRARMARKKKQRSLFILAVMFVVFVVLLLSILACSIGPSTTAIVTGKYQLDEAYYIDVLYCYRAVPSGAGRCVSKTLIVTQAIYDNNVIGDTYNP